MRVSYILKLTNVLHLQLLSNFRNVELLGIGPPIQNSVGNMDSRPFLEIFPFGQSE